MNKPAPKRQGNDTTIPAVDAELISMVAAAMDEIRKDETASDKPLDNSRWKTWRAP